MARTPIKKRKMTDADFEASGPIKMGSMAKWPGPAGALTAVDKSLPAIAAGIAGMGIGAKKLFDSVSGPDEDEERYKSYRIERRKQRNADLQRNRKLRGG